MTLITDVCRNRIRNLHVTLTQSPDDSTPQKRPEIRGRNPQCDAGDIACHRPEKGGSASTLIRQAPDKRGGDGLKKGEKRAQGTPEEDNIISGVDRAGEGILVRIEVVKDPVEKGCR
jgi:hypothetical protein